MPFRSRSEHYRRSAGFTLVEVLVSLWIFSMIGLAAHLMLRTVIDSHDRTEASRENLASLMRAMSVLETDLSQVVPRGIRDRFGDAQPALAVPADESLIEFTRSGWRNPLRTNRSNMQRVSYNVEDEQLIRRFWYVLDRAEDSEPVEQVLLKGVLDLRISVADETGEQGSTWPSFSTNTPLPMSMELVLDTEDIGEIRRVVTLVAPALEIRSQGSELDILGKRDKAEDGTVIGEIARPGQPGSRKSQNPGDNRAP
ncbi:MAG: type II secretion system protein GspJ [Gammaproteobacteria bacterium]|nr:type II secretion system protein GspJ [Gammaproteobacteria bacterium]